MNAKIKQLQIVNNQQHTTIKNSFVFDKLPNQKKIFNSHNEDYSDRKSEYVCRWLNHSFRPFTKKQKELAEMVIENYKKIK